jgi:hypothetical protein
MPVMSRRLFMGGLSLAAATPWLGSPAPVAAQSDDKDGVTFRTYDDVTLQGYLTRSAAGGNRSPVVIMLHGYGDDPNKGDFPGLARKLSEKGFNVLRFDFRGHGRSTLIASKFWNDFRGVRGGAYYPRLADDVMAARVALDQMNDSSEVNTSSVYLIGAKDAVTLGMLYISAEWSRPQKLPPGIINQFPLLGPRNRQTILNPGDACCGWDVAGAVWLSPVRNPAVPLPAIQSWVLAAPEMRERTPMLFIYGDKDTRSKAEARTFMNDVLAARVPGGAAPNLPLTQLRGIEKTDLVGVNLLGKDLGTEKLIIDYLEALEKERKNMIRVPNRGYTPPPPGINLPAFGVCKI